jgi:RNA ligase (TIGR02306 family)
MSTFAVTIERIAAVWAHTNADRLAMARLESMSYQFVIAKDSFVPGDRVVYFPIDSLLPESLITALGLTGKLAGSAKNRVKTVRLRGEISQGVVAEPRVVIPEWSGEAPFAEGTDLTERLGVIKYEPPPIISEEGVLGAMPPMVSVYDIENIERHGAIVAEYLIDSRVVITEKLEGSHFSASYYTDGSIVVCQRHYQIHPNTDGKPDHDWIRVSRELGLHDALPKLKAAIEARCGRPIAVVTVRGEMIGPSIQGNLYKLPARTIRIFEIEADGQPIDAIDYLELMAEFNLPGVPVLATDVVFRTWLSDRTIAASSNGESVLLPKVAREGIVIRPMREASDSKLGRVILKQRSPEYLAGNDF